MLHYIIYRHLSDYRLFHKLWGYVDEMKHEVSMQYENLRNFATLQNVKLNSSRVLLNASIPEIRSFLEKWQDFKTNLLKYINR